MKKLITCLIFLAKVASADNFRTIEIPQNINDQYIYHAKVDNVVDGDTVDLSLDINLNLNQNIGFDVTVDNVHITIKHRFRLYGINAWESHQTSVAGEKQKGLIAKEWLKNLIEKKELYVLSIKDGQDKYGRYLGILLIPKENGKFDVVNQMLVDQGHAKYADY